MPSAAIGVISSLSTGRPPLPGARRLKRSRASGTVGKTPAAGGKDRANGKINAAVVAATDKPTLQQFVGERVAPDAVVYTDEHGVYRGLPNREPVSHGTGEIVRGMAHTNCMESRWSLMKRGNVGACHHMSKKHLQRYVNEFAGRQNQGPPATADQMAHVAQGGMGKRLTHCQLTA